VNRELEAPALLLEWLARADHEAVDGWEPEPAPAELRCGPELVARLTAVARPVGPVRRRFVAGCPVIHHPRGAPIAAAAGTSWLVVRSGMAAGALRSSDPPAPGLEPHWVELDPWVSDTAFARATDLLRAHVARAYELAEAGA
jgi:hypothetical protein